MLQHCSCSKLINTCWKVHSQCKRLGRAEQFHPVTRADLYRHQHQPLHQLTGDRCAQPSRASHLCKTCPGSVLGVTQHSGSDPSLEVPLGPAAPRAGGCGGRACAVVPARCSFSLWHTGQHRLLAYEGNTSPLFASS